MTTEVGSILKVFITEPLDKGGYLLLERIGSKFRTPIEITADLSQPNRFGFFEQEFRNRFGERTFARYKKFGIESSMLEVGRTYTIESRKRIHRGKIELDHDFLSDIVSCASGDLLLLHPQRTAELKELFDQSDFEFMQGIYGFSPF